MDFGSSHVYAGEPCYSDPDGNGVASPPMQNDTIYEAVHEMYNQPHQATRSENTVHSYDPVYFSSDGSDLRAYDLVPYEPELDTTTEETNSTTTEERHAHPKRSLSSAVLHKAKKVTHWKNKKTKPSKSTGSISEYEDMPSAPTISQQNKLMKPLPPIPDETPQDSLKNKPLPPTPNEMAIPDRVLRDSPKNNPLPPTPNEMAVLTNPAPRIPPPRIPPKPASLKRKPPRQTTTLDELTKVFSDVNVENSCLAKPQTPAAATHSVPSALYPSLPNVYSDINYGKAGKEATAPPMDIMVMNSSNFDLISFDDEPILVEMRSTIETQRPKNTSIGAQAVQATSAPVLSASMVKRDTQSKNMPKNQYAAADTNVVSVKLGILENASNSMVWAMPPVHCSTCKAVLHHQAMTQNQDSGVCRFCGNVNNSITEAVLPLVGNESDITYVLNQQAPSMTDDPVIVFCVDTSGSMCVSSEVKGSDLFVSRLQGVQDGIIQQLNKLRQTRPKVRVAIVTFSNMVILYGDGSPAQYMALNDAQLFDTDFIKTAANNVILPGCIENTHMQLSKTVNMLKEHGGTALGPALFLSVALASRKSGSQVIVCTDGRANVGIGSLELESDYKMCHNFYRETSDYGIQRGTVVSILCIEGTDCRLVELGKVADKTAGKVKITDSQNIAEEFGDVLSLSLMATQVDVNIVTQKELYFHESDSKCQSRVGSFVGNATKDTEITFKYGIQESEESSPPQSALFQLQVKYCLHVGCTCLRVITQSRPITENRMLAEQGLNAAVVGTYASQLASKLFFEGDLRDAKLATDAHKKLIHRALSVRSTRSTIADVDDERIYGSVCHHIDELNQEIDRVVKSVRATPSPTPSTEVPPPLPPRLSETPKSLSRSSSVSSLSLPEVPNTPLATREKLKEAVEHCPDEVARKLYKHRNACGKMFSAGKY